MGEAFCTALLAKNDLIVYETVLISKWHLTCKRDKS